MNGELLLKGYKFPRQLVLNFLDKTVITGEDTFTAFEIFNMLENYFSRKTFSDYYLDKGTVLILNGSVLSCEEFAVFRLHPTINLAEELKITKKSVVGQVAAALFPESKSSFAPVVDALRQCLLDPLNNLTGNYGLSYNCDDSDIFTFAKILQPTVTGTAGEDILAREHDQFYCKAMLLDFIAKLKINKKKLLLVELPEYGLKEDEVPVLLNLLKTAAIDNILVYTTKAEICEIIPQIYNYNVIKNGNVFGFDDYDRLEITLQGLFINSSEEEIQQKVLEYIFQRPNWQKKDEFAMAVENFLN